jgi:hypothetical protein
MPSTLPPYRPQPAPGYDDESQLNAAFDFIRQLARERYFGIIQLSLQNGHLINIRRDESLKPETIQNLLAHRKGNSHVYKSE